MALNVGLVVAYVAAAKYPELVQAKTLTPDLASIPVLEVISYSILR